MVGSADDIYGFTPRDASGEPHAMANYRGSVVLIVNTASQCGFTPQYKDLEALWQAYRDKGLVVLGFPCNQFGRQEPDDIGTITRSCEMRYGVSFPILDKIDVNGKNAEPLFQYLKREKPGLLGMRSIKWNFTKFLVDQRGSVVARYGPKTNPKIIEPTVSDMLS